MSKVVISKFLLIEDDEIFEIDAQFHVNNSPKEIFREYVKSLKKDNQEKLLNELEYYYVYVDDSYSDYDKELFAKHVVGCLSISTKRRQWRTSFISDEMVKKLEWIKYEPTNEDYKEYLLLAYVNECGTLYNVWNYYENIEVLKRHMEKSKTGCNVGISKIYYQSYPNWKEICKERVYTHSSEYVFNLDEWTELIEIENDKNNHYSFHKYPLSKIVFNKSLSEQEFIEMFDLEEVALDLFKATRQIENDLMLSVDINYTNKETPFIVKKGQKSNDISRTVRKYRG